MKSEGNSKRREGINQRHHGWSRALAASAAALVAASALAACGGGSSNGSNHTTKRYGTVVRGSLPSAGTPSNGGTITAAQLSGRTPTDIFPLIDGATCSTETIEFVSNQYVPLYYGPTGAQPKIDYGLSAAQAPQYSNGDRTVTINIKPGLKWSDGKPVDAQDVIFYFDLLKAALKESPANWCQYSPGVFPENAASWTTKGTNTVVIQLKHAVNPTWFTTNNLQDTNGGVYPMPSQDWNVAAAGGPHITDWATNPASAQKIYDYLHTQGAAVATFASSPLWKVVDGPFKLKDFSATNSSYDLVPNPSYGLSPKPRLADFSMQTYTGLTPMLNALESGSLDIGNGLDAATQHGSFSGLQHKGYSVYGSPLWGWFGGIMNFKNTTDHFDKVVAQPYIRGVFAELVNDPAIIKGVYHGWAVPAYGPVASAPDSPYISASIVKPAWPYNPSKAVSTLKAHGWDVKPGAQTTCAKPGSGPDQCGAGIPKGTPITFVWANQPESASAVGVLESETFASEAKQAAGINVKLVTKTFNFLTANYNNQNPAAAKYVNDWGVNNFGGITVDYYPTQDGVLSPGGSLNMGDYNDPVANRLMAASTVSPSSAAIEQEVQYFTKSYPVFYMPMQDWIMAVSSRVGSTPNGFLQMTQQQINPQLLYVKKHS